MVDANLLKDYNQTSVSKLPPVVSLAWSETLLLFDYLAFINVHFLSNPFKISILRGACPMMVYDCLSSGPGTFTAEKKNLFTAKINPDAFVFVLRDIPKTSAQNTTCGTTDTYCTV